MKLSLAALLVVAAFFPGLAHAGAYERIACLGRDHGRATYLEANLAGPSRLDHVMLRVFAARSILETRDRMLGARDASEVSPLRGTRFYFRSGNTATFLLLRDSELPGVRSLLNATDLALRNAFYDARYTFRLLYVFEGIEQGWFREVTELVCGPKAPAGG